MFIIYWFKAKIYEVIDVPFTFAGTLSRRTYWHAIIFWLAVWILSAALSGALFEFLKFLSVDRELRWLVDDATAGLLFLFGFVVYVQLVVKRLRDLEASTWLVLVAAVPLGGILIQLPLQRFWPEWIANGAASFVFVWLVYLGTVEKISRKALIILALSFAVPGVAILAWPRDADDLLWAARHEDDWAKKERILRRAAERYPYRTDISSRLYWTIGHEFSEEAEKHIAAGDLDAAEHVLKQGLFQEPRSRRLKRDLVDLYVTTNQWGKLDDWLLMNRIPNGGSLSFSALGDIASHYFDNRQWEKAAKYYRDAAWEDYEAIAEETASREELERLRDVRYCRYITSLELERLRNSAAAGANGGGLYYVEQALRDLLRSALAGATSDIRSSCNARDNRDAIAEYVNEIWNWLPESNRKEALNGFDQDGLSRISQWLGWRSADR